ncbi:MAG: hypothetical protein ACOX52_05850 [Verrucomicrobiota bacterium]
MRAFSYFRQMVHNHGSLLQNMAADIGPDLQVHGVLQDEGIAWGSRNRDFESPALRIGKRAVDETQLPQADQIQIELQVIAGSNHSYWTGAVRGPPEKTTEIGPTAVVYGNAYPPDADVIANQLPDPAVTVIPGIPHPDHRNRRHPGLQTPPPTAADQASPQTFQSSG